MKWKKAMLLHYTIRGMVFFLFIIFSCTLSSQSEKPPLNFDYLTIQEGLSHNTIFCMIQDHHGYIWVGTQNGLNKYDGYTFEIFRSGGDEADASGFIGKTISSIFEDSEGNIWVGTRKHGLNILKNGYDVFENLQNDPVFSEIRGADISSINQDQEGNIWLTTVGAGVLKYDPIQKGAKHFTSEEHGLSNNLAFDLVEDKQGTIWVVAAGIGINFMTKGSDQFQINHVNLYQNPDMNGYRKSLLLDWPYLWIGTEGSGLYKMHIPDRTYTHFSKGESPDNLNSDLVRDILKGPDGKLYLATDGGGMNVLDLQQKQILKYTYQPGESAGINSNALYRMMEDRVGNLWIGSYNGGLNVYKIQKTWFDFFTPTSDRVGELESRSILSIHQSQDGTIWLGTDGGGLNKLLESENNYSVEVLKNDPQNQNSLAGNVVKTIFEDRNRNLWIGMFGLGLDRYDPVSITFSHLQNQIGIPTSLSNNNVWSIAEKNDGKLWIGTIGGGVSVYDPSQNQFTYFLHDTSDVHSVAANDIMVVFVDRQGEVWIGTADFGLDRWVEEENRFTHYQHDEADSFSISNNEIRAIYQDQQDRIWIGTEGGGLNLWRGQGRFKHLKIEDGLIANSVMGITEDLLGMIWITTFRGISRLNPETYEILNFDFHTGQNNNQFNQSAILTSKNGRLFFGGINGLNSIRPEHVKEDTVRPDILFTGLKVFNEDIKPGVGKNGKVILQKPIEDADRIELQYGDNAFSLDFTAIDYTRPREHVYQYKMEGFDDNWRNTSAGSHTVSYTNLDPGSFTFRVRHKSKEASIDVIIKPPFWETYWFRILALLFIVGVILLGMIIIIKRREAIHKQELLEAERRILQLQNVQLENQVLVKNSKLMFSAVQMAHKNEILATVKQELKDLDKSPNKALYQLMRRLDRELMSEDYWKEFNVYFDQVDHQFVHEIYEKHSDLTNHDLRLCTLLRINLSTKEIASLLNISVRGVEKARYRLKKRLGLTKEDDLIKYIATFRKSNPALS